MREELEEGTRIVEASECFIAAAPFASSVPFLLHIYPRRHAASFGDITEREVADLARVLRSVLRRLYFGLGNPDFNYVIETAPAEDASTATTASESSAPQGDERPAAQDRPEGEGRTHRKPAASAGPRTCGVVVAQTT